MVQPTNRDGKSVADFPAQRPLLGKLDVVGIGRGAPADEARLGGHKPQMVAIAFADRLADGEDPLGRCARVLTVPRHGRPSPELQSAPRVAYRRAGPAWLQMRFR